MAASGVRQALPIHEEQCLQQSLKFKQVKWHQPISRSNGGMTTHYNTDSLPVSAWPSCAYDICKCSPGNKHTRDQRATGLDFGMMVLHFYEERMNTKACSELLAVVHLWFTHILARIATRKYSVSSWPSFNYDFDTVPYEMHKQGAQWAPGHHPKITSMSLDT